VATTLTAVRHAYIDSVSLLQLSAEVAALKGVLEAALVMGTDLNREVLRDSGLLVGQAQNAGANDLVIAIRAEDEGAARAALERAEALLAGRRRDVGSNQQLPPRSIRSARRADPAARLAVISVPGPYAAAEARQALAEGLHVFLFSDNVSLEDEIALKQAARQKGLLVMGPDCGTAIINGIGLGFANVVRPGNIGVIGASGTGIQELVSLVHRAAGGISHAIGTGSRDLSGDVGGITTLQAIDLLREDPATETIVLLSKPPDPDVARSVLAALSGCGKRAIVHFQGLHVSAPEGVRVARNLEECAALALDRPVANGLPAHVPLHGAVRGLFCGGTLCTEAALTLGQDVVHELIDFGDDEYTRGRAHPMIDPTLRNQAIVQAGKDSRVAVLLLDFILGYGAHADPAGAALPAIHHAQTARPELAVAVHVVGTDADPQNLARQEELLREAGVQVFGSNYAAASAVRTALVGVTA
jgi:FdrA protein